MLLLFVFSGLKICIRQYIGLLFPGKDSPALSSQHLPIVRKQPTSTTKKDWQALGPTNEKKEKGAVRRSKLTESEINRETLQQILMKLRIFQVNTFKT